MVVSTVSKAGDLNRIVLERTIEGLGMSLLPLTSFDRDWNITVSRITEGPGNTGKVPSQSGLFDKPSEERQRCNHKRLVAIFCICLPAKDLCKTRLNLTLLTRKIRVWDATCPIKCHAISHLWQTCDRNLTTKYLWAMWFSWMSVDEWAPRTASCLNRSNRRLHVRPWCVDQAS